MDMIQHLKAEINDAVNQSILLRPDMRSAIKAKAATCTDVEALRHMLGLLLREKEYIVKYLQEVIKIDTTGLTVYKLRELMQKSYLNSIHQRESGSLRADRAEAEATMAKISL